MLDKTALSKIIDRHQELEQWLYSGDQSNRIEAAARGREHARLGIIVQDIERLFKLNDELAATEKMIASSQNEKELLEMAKQEKADLLKQVTLLETRIVQKLMPSQEDNDRGAIVEFRSGTGGEEAALFARELLTMYQRYSQEQGWKMQMLSLNLTDLGGVKEASAEITGTDVFAKLKFESGVHRVQRVPLTESSGRIHTSAATVAVLPIAEETDLEIKTEDLRIDVYRSSGPGGQSVNTTDSAVRITHLPTGLVVCCQDEKSQHRNKASAMKILRSRLYDLEIAKKQSERSQLRKTQVGTGDRSERIRTYNFPQNRVTDHRINFVLHDLTGVLSGKIEPIVDQLIKISLEKQTAQALVELSS